MDDWVIFFSCLCFLMVSSRNISAQTILLDQLLNLTEYDRAQRPPGLNKTGPCLVEIDMVLNSVGPVSSLEMEMTSSFYLRQEWLDPRLSFENRSDIEEPISISLEYMERLWIPDLFFVLGIKTYRHDSTTPNLFLRLWSNGTVLYSQRITSTMKCEMDLSNFPHDQQRCKSSMMSYSYTTNDLIFQWSSKRKAAILLPSAYLAEFLLTDVEVADCTETFATGTFPCLESIMTLQRQMGFYLTQTYIPSVLIVMLSWAAFWIDHEAVPARISVGLLTVLTITTQSSGARSQLPRVSYIKAIDVWMSANLIFVFTAYMEYAVVTITSRKYKRLLRNSGEKVQPKKEAEGSRRGSESVDGEYQMRSMSLDQSGDVNTTVTKSRDITVSMPTFTADNVNDRLKGCYTVNGVGLHQTHQDQYVQQQQVHHYEQEAQSSQHHHHNHQHHQKQQKQYFQQQQQQLKHRSSTRAAGLAQESTDGSFTNLGFIGDILSEDDGKKQRKKRLSLWQRKRRKHIYLRNYGRRVDYHSRYLFPLSYVIFNFVYWTYYLLQT